MGRLTAPKATFTGRRQGFDHCGPRRLGELRQALGEDAIGVIYAILPGLTHTRSTQTVISLGGEGLGSL
jgi:hypothetical protein